jgi:hypothetical protein
MTAVSFDISMSLDEYIAAPNRRPEEPLGDNGGTPPRVGVQQRHRR